MTAPPTSAERRGMKAYIILNKTPDGVVPWRVFDNRADADLILRGKTQFAENRYAVLPVEVDDAEVAGLFENTGTVGEVADPTEARDNTTGVAGSSPAGPHHPCWKCGGDDLYCAECGERESSCECQGEWSPIDCDICGTGHAGGAR